MNGDTVKFTIVDGKQQGPATETFMNGDTLQFTFEDGKIQGPAIQTFMNGDTLAFTFEDDKPQGAAVKKANCSDKQSRLNGFILEFTYLNGMAQGKAKLSSPQGTVTEIFYRDNLPLHQRSFEMDSQLKNFVSCLAI
jgi:hypothetical protein